MLALKLWMMKHLIIVLIFRLIQLNDCLVSKCIGRETGYEHTIFFTNAQLGDKQDICTRNVRIFFVCNCFLFFQINASTYTHLFHDLFEE